MCIEDDNNNMRTPWARAEICARPEKNHAGDKRLSASFARRMMYQATVPDGQNKLIFAKNKTSLTVGSHFPAVDITKSTARPESVAFTPAGPLWDPLLRVTNFDQPDIVTVPTILAPTGPTGPTGPPAPPAP